MHVVYAKQPLPTSFTKALFLAGPTPRDKAVSSWRPEALRLLRASGFTGVVFVPETEDGEWKHSYEDQVEWEEAALHMSDCILFWVPRDMATLPGLTTNVEFGRWYESGKYVFGAPPNAVHVKYLEYYAKKFQVSVSASLEDTVKAAIAHTGTGALRTGGECQVPLYIWNTIHFQQWYSSLKESGNRLDSARVEWVFRAGPQQKTVFFWALHVDIYVTGEDRHKTNEIVLSRPDIATIVMYRKGAHLKDTEIVLIREFRSPVSNLTGFVWELPGGSSFKPGKDPRVLAADECAEETGFPIPPERIKLHGARQILATMSAQCGHVFSVELTADEIERLRTGAGIAHGVVEDTERTYVEIRKLDHILSEKLVDWSMLGMILGVLTE